TFDDLLNFTGKGKTKIQGERIAIILSDQQLTPDPQIAATAMELPPPKMNAEWTEPGGSPDNLVGNLMAAGPLAQLWSVSAGKGSNDDARLTAPPIIAGGLAFVLDAEAHVFAFDAATGKSVWDKSLVPAADRASLLEKINPFSAGRSIAATKGFGGGLAW